MSGGLPPTVWGSTSVLGNRFSLMGAQQTQAWVQQQALLQQQAFLNAANAQFARSSAPRWLKPDPKQPDTLGWRQWDWDADHKCLRSPSQGTLWETDRHVVPQWDEADVVRGVAGVHALLVPRHWKIASELGHFPIGESTAAVTGIVERFGRYVLGTEGWRAEQVVIRELLAPSTAIGLEIEQKYPDVIVHYPEEEPCKLETLSALEKGSRSLLPSTQPSPPVPTPPLIQTVTVPMPTAPTVLTPSPARTPMVLFQAESESPSPHEIAEANMLWTTAMTVVTGCLGAFSILMLLR